MGKGEKGVNLAGGQWLVTGQLLDLEKVAK